MTSGSVEETRKQHVVLCEGFEDRAFWAGFLLSVGCIDPTDQGRVKAKDSYGRPVAGKGRYLFYTPSQSSIILQPIHGKDNARSTLKEYLTGTPQLPDSIILNIDSDASAAGSEQPTQDLIDNLVLDFGGCREDGKTFLHGVRFHPVVWRCNDPATAPGIPEQQTLERLVAAAVCAAYPERGPDVYRWLNEGCPGLGTAKSYAYSYLAKWYSDHSANDFYRAVWDDQELIPHLRERIEDIEALEDLLLG